MRTIEIKSADGIVFVIEFHRTADRCWHLTLTGDRHIGFQPNAYDRVERVSADAYCIECTSLERLMAFVAEYIGRTEF